VHSGMKKRPNQKSRLFDARKIDLAFNNPAPRTVLTIVTTQQLAILFAFAATSIYQRPTLLLHPSSFITTSGAVDTL